MDSAVGDSAKLQASGLKSEQRLKVSGAKESYWFPTLRVQLPLVGLLCCLTSRDNSLLSRHWRVKWKALAVRLWFRLGSLDDSRYYCVHRSPTETFVGNACARIQWHFPVQRVWRQSFSWAVQWGRQVGEALASTDFVKSCGMQSQTCIVGCCVPKTVGVWEFFSVPSNLSKISPLIGLFISKVWKNVI